MLETKTPTAPAVETGNPAGPDGGPSRPVDAGTLAVQHRGNKGGKARLDGLVPGSPEAIEADRKKDAERKRLARAGTPPPRLPANPTALPTKVDQPQAPSGDAPRQLWNPQHVKPVVRSLLKSIEKVRVRAFLAKAHEILDIDGDEDAEFLAQVEKDARWDAEAVAELEAAGAEWGARILDRMGVPASASGGVRTLAAFVRLVVQDMLQMSNLNDMLRKRKKEKAEEEKRLANAKPVGGAA